MTNPKINISSLDFENIKASLREYLETQDNLDFDFNASGINLLLDLLAYNTLYYSFYSNMIANETFLDTAQIENNIVSLVKPLGYLVSGKTCSRIEAKITSVPSTGTIIPYFSYFSSVNSSGSSYRFYPIGPETINLTNQEQTDIILYEGKNVVNDLEVSVDLKEQKAFLGTIDVDLDTVRVKVIRNGVEKIWSRFNNFQSPESNESEVYFIDRTSSGFYLVFGRRTLNDYQAYFGKDIEENDIVKVSYIIPTGSAANNLTNLNNSSVNILSFTPSSGGRDSVDLNLVKFFAPKLFAANDRAVTKDDYYGILLSSNMLPASVTVKEQINVWGGEEAEPASYGRVFISFADPSLTIENEQIKKSITFLKNKSVVSILPEYIQPQLVGVELNVIAFNATTAQLPAIKTFIENYYNTPYKFNNNVYGPDIRQLITTRYTNVQSVDINNAMLSLQINGSGTEKSIYFKNKLSSANNSITTTEFVYKGTSITLTNNSEGYLVSPQNPNFGNLGYVDYNNGIISINYGVIPTGVSVTIKAKVDNVNNINIKNEFLVNLTATISSS